MTDIKLDDRLKSVVSLVDKGDVVGDIGCDHGYVPNYLVENNISSYVYATDVVSYSIDKINKEVNSRKNQDKIKVLKGDGLTPLINYDIDTIIMSGMGGNLIIKILNKNLGFIDNKTLILQPQTEVRSLRLFLKDIGFKVIEEKICKVGDFFYEILKCVPGEYKSVFDFRLGENLIYSKDPVMLEYIKYLQEKEWTLIQHLEQYNSVNTDSRRKELLQNQKFYEEIINEYYS